MCICICERIPTHKYLYYGHWFAQHLLLKLFLSYHDDVEETNVRYILNCISSFPSSKGIKKQKKEFVLVCVKKKTFVAFLQSSTHRFSQMMLRTSNRYKTKNCPNFASIVLTFYHFCNTNCLVACLYYNILPHESKVKVPSDLILFFNKITFICFWKENFQTSYWQRQQAKHQQHRWQQRRREEMWMPLKLG